MRKWHYKADEAGRPRRFLSHAEAARWVFLKVAKFSATPVLIALANALLLHTFFDYRLSLSFIFLAVASLLILLLLVSAAMYLYLSLSGGIIGREERRSR